MSNEIDHNRPAVSVIVPVYNDRKYIGKLIESLLGQDYPEGLIEVIIIDNNSSDDTKEIVCQYPVTLLEENDIQSSYAARNKGIINAKHDILAFIDSDCVASRQWIDKGVSKLLDSGADLVGAKVDFILSSKRAAAEMYDAITHFDFENSIKNQQGTGAGNLFVHRYVFDKIGLFPGNVESGGDFQWSRRAIQNGLKLVYSAEAIVGHPARNLKSLLKKRLRTGGGTFEYWRKAGIPGRKVFLLMGRMCIPRRYSMLKKAINERGTSDMHKKVLRIWLVSYICSLTTLFVVLISFFRPINKRDASKKEL